MHEPQFERLEKLITGRFNRLEKKLSTADDALGTQVAALQAEDGVVIKALQDLKFNPDPAVQAAADTIQAEIAAVDAEVQKDDPGAEPAPPQLRLLPPGASRMSFAKPVPLLAAVGLACAFGAAPAMALPVQLPTGPWSRTGMRRAWRTL